MKEIKFREWHKKKLKKWRVALKKTGELMQYTGLKDKNGVECYWDDIVSDGINPPFIVTEDYCLLARLNEIEFEIIGNIYENPELVTDD